MPMIVTVLVLGASTLALQAAKQTKRPLAELRTTEQRMKRIEQALKAYWITHSCNSLPDPDTVAPGSAVVPLRELGLQSEDALDAWGRLITFRYDPPPGGLSVNVSGTPTPVRWVLISHGPSGLGAWLPGGIQRLPLPAVGNPERDNTQIMTVEFYQLPTSAPTDSDPATSTTHFDDIVRFGEWALNDCAVAGGGSGSGGGGGPPPPPPPPPPP
ncbi:MAG: hypothetical protein Q7J66_09675, partial [Hydrogenophaga sp.]|nr:hypothetical protein [Hydrogenophaga sp.]